MVARFNIHCKIDNPVLCRLLAEQIAVIKDYECNPDAPADCLVLSSPSESSCPSVVLPRGAVRLGEVMDRIKYTLSGRDDHIEDEGLVLTFGGFRFSPADNTLTHLTSGDVLRLTDKERLMLRVLYQAGEMGMSRSDLLRAVWGYSDSAETHTLETHLYRLRQKLSSYHDGSFIRVENGIYILAE